MCGSDRIVITWADNAIPNANWLRVTVLANANTGLAANDVHYWGSSIGETNNNPPFTDVTSADEIECRNNKLATSPVNVPMTNIHDFDRNMSVTSADEIWARNNKTSSTGAPWMLWLMYPAP